MADARAVGGRARDEVSAEGHAERRGTLDAEIVQHRVRRALPLRLERHARQDRVPLAWPIEGDGVEWAGGEVGREVDDLLRVSVEAVHHDERRRGTCRGLRAVRRVRLPAHRGQLPATIGHCVTGECEASVGLVEGGRHGVDEAPLARVVRTEVEGRELMEAPRGVLVALGGEAFGEALGELRDLARRSQAGECGGCDRLHTRTVEDRCEGPVELQVELAIAGVFGEHVSTVSAARVRWTEQ